MMLWRAADVAHVAHIGVGIHGNNIRLFSDEGTNSCFVRYLAYLIGYEGHISVRMKQSPAV